VRRQPNSVPTTQGGSGGGEVRWNRQNTTRNTIMGCTLSEAVHLELLLEHISTAVQDMNHC
jgi:hypothetical protein